MELAVVKRATKSEQMALYAANPPALGFQTAVKRLHLHRSRGYRPLRRGTGTTNSSEWFKHFGSDEQLSELSKGYTPRMLRPVETVSDLGLFVVSCLVSLVALPALLGLLS